MKILKILLIVATLILLALGGRLMMLGQKSSQTPKNIGIENGHLKACGQKPNCVSSQAEPSSDFYIAPLSSYNIEGLWDDLNILLTDMGFKEISSQSHYLHYTHTSSIFRFVDDIEFLLDTENGIIEMRSQSRVGYSDLGVNRKRLEKIRASLKPKK